MTAARAFTPGCRRPSYPSGRSGRVLVRLILPLFRCAQQHPSHHPADRDGSGGAHHTPGGHRLGNGPGDQRIGGVLARSRRPPVATSAWNPAAALHAATPEDGSHDDELSRKTTPGGRDHGDVTSRLNEVLHQQHPSVSMAHSIRCSLECRRNLGGLLGGPRCPRARKFEEGWVIRDERAGREPDGQLSCYPAVVLKLKDLEWLLR